MASSRKTPEFTGKPSADVASDCAGAAGRPGRQSSPRGAIALSRGRRRTGARSAGRSPGDSRTAEAGVGVRARNIKPALFKNEVLGKADPLYTILFEGLWCMADRAGRLEDRPSRIKAEIFPYRDLDIEPLLEWLLRCKFIDRYMTKRGSVIEVVMFLKHQRPHQNEPQSELLPKNHKLKKRKLRPLDEGLRPLDEGLRSDSGSLIPSSLIPDTGYPIPDSGSRIPGHPPSASVRPIQGSKTILKNGSGERPVEGGSRSCDEPRPASEIAMQALRSKGLAR